jgi:Ti-type conjugative transfer relaxase TraA
MVASAKPMAAGKEGYYLGLTTSRGDDGYYTSGPEPPGVWFGGGAEAVGLRGPVQAADLEKLMRGFGPDGRPLVQNAGDKDRRAGVDLCFSAPKSVSVVWAIGDAATRRQVEAAHDAAVRRTLSWFEEKIASCRVGRGGKDREAAEIFAALFQHGCSRNQQMQLHSHALLLNVGLTADGKTRALDTADILYCKMLLGQHYHVELANELTARLGLVCEKHKSWFEIAGVPDAVLKHFSSRRQEILEHLAASGHSSPQAAAVATLETRREKEQLPREVLMKQWQAEASALGFDAGHIRELCGRAPVRDTSLEAKEAVARAVERLTRGQAHFTERELLRAVLEEAAGRGVWAARVEREVTEVLGRGQDIVCLGRRGSALHYTTQGTLAVERALLDAVDRSRGNSQHVLNAGTVSSVLRAHTELNPEQRRAVEHVTLEGGSIKLVAGMAGTGKSTILSSARECWEREHYRVIGAAVSGKAAEGLVQSAGIKSYTVARLIGSPELSFVGDFDKQGGHQHRVALDSRSVLVIDEAGMLNTRSLERLLREASRAGAKVVMVGDAKQLQPIGVGGPFKSLTERLPCASLETIVRQKDEWAREAVKEFARGQASQALRRFAAQGLLHVGKDREAAIEALLQSYAKDGLGAKEVEGKLIFTGTRLEAATFNARVQAARLAAGELRGDGVQHGNVLLFEGDRVLFTRNSRVLGVINGGVGTILAARGEEISVRLDGQNGRVVNVSLEEYAHVKLAYSVTTHVGQGVTTARAWVLAGGPMTDLHLSYVQTSRAREECEIHVDRAEAGKDLEELARAMSRDRSKDLAHDLMVAPNQQAAARHLHPECSWELQLEHRL